jgi:peroxiredoxin
MRTRWALAVVGVVALAAVAVNYYMPWRTGKGGEPSSRSAAATPVSCPVDAKPANLNFTLKDVKGKDVALSEYKGKVIMLDFWATWCGPCKVEIPGFVDFQNRYGKDGLQIIGISVDDTVEQLTPFINEYKMNYPVLQGLGRDEVAQAFGAVLALPHTVMISRDGKICAQLTGLTGHDVFEGHIKGLL